MRKGDAFLAIVGLGARGLHALELFFITLSRKQNHNNLTAIIFESRNILGTGPAWDPWQSPVVLSNISDRALETLHGREAFKIDNVSIEEFPSYWEWLREERGSFLSDDIDTFSQRQTTGQYLKERTQSILEPLVANNLVSIVRERIIDLQKTDFDIKLTTETSKDYRVQRLILAQGRVDMKQTTENEDFADHANEHHLTFIVKPYNVNLKSILSDFKTVIIKGLGLAMIDVVHTAVRNNDQVFESKTDSIFLRYVGNHHGTLVPYSLDGLPPVPKPVGKQIDDHFDPEPHSAKEIIQQLFENIENGKVTTLDDILIPVSRLTMRVYARFNHRFADTMLSEDDGVDLLLKWYRDHEIQHPHILDTTMPVVDYMKQTCEMSHNLRAFSLDYAAGQVWRYIQIEMYRLYRHDRLSSELIREYIAVEERAKRYSFGPPIKSILQLIALADAEVLNLHFVKSPEVDLNSNGFQLKDQNVSITSKCLINAVLPKSDLSRIDDPLMKSMLDKNYIEQLSNGLGIAVNARANPLVDDQAIDNIHILGRNALGSEYGVDALLECFNSELMQVVIDEVLN
ncbi:FAD/NAD(P)-binding protein [Nonlabens ponticola]|uniref:FAD-dependent urate hydroxylase HpyO/Asp monooxygenase CreE-like FAD/NAD(P)-binding domain-containing protein n=1 Tax=Nonlabens ponticola TaxID=2496866 RepID=A0A3S9MY76_9FLAO|nr:FAD/NAD(P)-binding protein [Nonlabens ponticola]AZQ44097.1 hypothetical protein EJ995_07580 [Nonlabens ponticola]